jgi:hypothetical protein
MKNSLKLLFADVVQKLLDKLTFFSEKKSTLHVPVTDACLEREIEQFEIILNLVIFSFNNVIMNIDHKIYFAVFN